MRRNPTLKDLRTQLGQPAHRIFSSCFEHLLAGQAVGTVTEIPINGPNGVVLNEQGGIPVSRGVRASLVAVSLKYAGSAPDGTFTLTLHRVRNGSASAVATFSFDA